MKKLIEKFNQLQKWQKIGVCTLGVAAVIYAGSYMKGNTAFSPEQCSVMYNNKLITALALQALEMEYQKHDKYPPIVAEGVRNGVKSRIYDCYRDGK